MDQKDQIEDVPITFRGTAQYRSMLAQAALDRGIKVKGLIQRAIADYLRDNPHAGGESTRSPIAIPPPSENVGKRDTFHEYEGGPNAKWHKLLAKVLNSKKHHRAITDNLISFADGIDAEEKLADLQRRIDGGEFANHLPATPINSPIGLSAVERKATQTGIAAEEAQSAAKKLRGVGRPHPTDPGRNKPAENRTPKTPGSGS